MKLSIIIVNYNVAYFLEQCLHSVALAMRGLEVEVMVVDNHSSDGSGAMVRKKFPWVRLIENVDNKGFSRANNQAIKMSAGEYVLLLNPDTVIEEDSLHKVIRFMDAHPEAGGLGVKMVDGRGRFLPESKRGLPTPRVAFFKVFGISRLFPKSGRFNSYHLGNLSKEDIHEVEILSGAFMLMRKSVLDQVGLLDEAFFMYGEDIDLSWRIILGGSKNYYFPETSIIHYKGESTKKGSLNYVFVFYKAMIIFAEKHFSQTNAKIFSLLINMAIYLRAAMAIANRFIQRMWLPLVDLSVTIFLLSFTSFLLPSAGMNCQFFRPESVSYCLPYSALWVLAIFLAGGYDKPYMNLSFIKGLLVSLLLLQLSAWLVPQWPNFIFSAWLMVSVLLLIYFILTRRLLANVFPKRRLNGVQRSLRVVIIGEEDEVKRVRALIEEYRVEHRRILNMSEHPQSGSFYDGDLSGLAEFINEHRIQEVVFCAKNLSPSQIIQCMSKEYGRALEYRIAPADGDYIIGSNSIQTSGDVFIAELNAIYQPHNRREKRLFDVISALLLLLISPLLLIWIEEKNAFFKNLLAVLSGKKSWVGYHPEAQKNPNLPPINPGILYPLDYLNEDQLSAKVIGRGNLIYARDYHVSDDLSLLFKCLRKLGRRV